MKTPNFYEKHKKLSIFSLGLVLLLAFFYFNNDDRVTSSPGYGKGGAVADYAVMESKSISSSEYGLAQDESTLPGSQDAKVIKTASLSLHVDDVRAKAEEIKTMVSAWGGYIGDVNINRYDNSYSASMTLRVPETGFDGALSALKDIAVYVNNEYSNSSDVTLYYNDLEAKIANRKALEQQYLEILKQAADLEGIAAITKALADVRSEIESFEIEKKSYDNQINYSTISVYLEEDASAEAVGETWSAEETYHQAEADFKAFLYALADKAIYVWVYGWPLLILALIYGLYRLLKRRK